MGLWSDHWNFLCCQRGAASCDREDKSPPSEKYRKITGSPVLRACSTGDFCKKSGFIFYGDCDRITLPNKFHNKNDTCFSCPGGSIPFLRHNNFVNLVKMQIPSSYCAGITDHCLKFVWRQSECAFFGVYSFGCTHLFYCVPCAAWRFGIFTVQENIVTGRQFQYIIIIE